jgi:hypothetical protein
MLIVISSRFSGSDRVKAVSTNRNGDTVPEYRLFVFELGFAAALLLTFDAGWTPDAWALRVSGRRKTET